MRHFEPFVNSRAKAIYYIILQNNPKSTNVYREALVKRINSICQMSKIAKKRNVELVKIPSKNIMKNKRQASTYKKNEPDIHNSNIIIHKPNNSMKPSKRNHTPKSKVVPLKLPIKISNLHERMQFEKIPEKSVARPRLTKFSHES